MLGSGFRASSGPACGAALLLLASAASAEGTLDRTGHSCAASVKAGPRAGGTINQDQWAFGGHARLGLLCLGGFAIETAAIVGLGGNYLTLRPSARLQYHFGPGGERSVSVYPSAGYSLLFYRPVGDFESFCDRYDVDACYDSVQGFELGGGVGYWLLGVEGLVGFGGLPVVTIAVTATFPLFGAEHRELTP
jgi:hypothetical protein